MNEAIQQDFSLKDNNTLRLDVRCRFFAQPRSLDALREAIRVARGEAVPVFVLGEGSNVLFRENFPGMVIRVDLRGMEVQPTEEGALVTAAAGENWDSLVRFTLDQELYGLENLSLIPGSVGAAPVQNIGAYGAELADVLEDLELLEPATLQVRRLRAAECGFAYRHSAFREPALAGTIITSVRLRLRSDSPRNVSYAPVRGELEAMGIADPDGRAIAEAVCRIRRRRLPDPARIGNVGSFFKNPVVAESRARDLRAEHPELPVTASGEGWCKLSAAWMIDRCGLKGTSIGDAAVSEQHALVLVNRGAARPEHFVALAELVLDAVEARFGIRLEIEPSVC